MIKRILFLLFISLTQPIYSQSPKVVAYIAGWTKFNAADINAKTLTHLNYAFANIKNGEVVSDNDKDRQNFEELLKLKTINPNLKLIISVGGWAWSNNFSDAALTPESRKRFAVSALNYIKQFKLDGIDIDWEYPALPGAGNIHRKEDKHNFTLLLQALRTELDAGGSAKQKLSLTVATGGMDEYIENTELNIAYKYLDFINIMSYDLYNGWDSITGHHAGLYLPLKYTKKLSADHAVQLHLNQGVPPAKLILGVPFYGRRWKGVTAVNNGFDQSAKTGGQGINYNQLYPLINQKGYKRIWDTVAQAPYLWNEEEKEFISYDDEQSVTIKCAYVKQKGLGGVMFWEYHGDYNGQLLKVIEKELK